MSELFISVFTRLLRAVAPGLINWVRAYRQRRLFCRAHKFDQRVFRVAFYPQRLTPVVLTGPFRGMKYLDEVVWGPIKTGNMTAARIVLVKESSMVQPEISASLISVAVLVVSSLVRAKPNMFLFEDVQFVGETD